MYDYTVSLIVEVYQYYSPLCDLCSEKWWLTLLSSHLDLQNLGETQGEQDRIKLSSTS